ncbi:MAG: hypothetical protein M3468_02355 [Acidobacteriota bacterium]|nr:hypothetical protein [Acidobacteriota bacterium]
MSDPRNVAHAKKVTQEKKHQGGAVATDEMPTAQPGKKMAAPKKSRGKAAASDAPVASESVVASDLPAAKPSASLEGSLTVLAKLKEMEFYSRANLEQLAALGLTVEDELKQKEMVAPLGDVLSAQNAFQTKLTALLEAYKAECDRMQGAPGSL